ncbi:hypothetical protein O6P32_11860 [Phocaeicola sp. KGMB11183]|uniref:DUF4377 domain-containing protein n=1 Tax=Phocaeicola acetigenes TaxID=3016083 RepID=A0ABT4PK09_9BACT|nr:hypothetical protein [Phocaeicola sp. KGMB11183]MCZ8373392.1 hypothetical protein [Phocaeicola sp. KGMB11183]
MKQTLFFLLLSPLLLWACKDDEQCPANDYVEATFQLTGEWTKDYPSSIPDNKNNLYGIEILYPDKDSWGIPYAYGLFDDIGLAKVKLQKGVKYKIRVIIAPNGKQTCTYSPEENAYGDVFIKGEDLAISSEYTNCPLSNSFIYDSRYHFCQFSCLVFPFYNKIYKAGISDYLAETDSVIPLNAKRGFIIMNVKAVQFTSPSGELTIDIRRHPARQFTFTPEHPEQTIEWACTTWTTDHGLPDNHEETIGAEIYYQDNSPHAGWHELYVERNFSRGQEYDITIDCSAKNQI